jgi:Family of unknown function (DUF5670)
VNNHVKGVTHTHHDPGRADRPLAARNGQLWLLGMVSSYTLGGFIHILLVVAVAVFLIRLIQGRGVV